MIVEWIALCIGSCSQIRNALSSAQSLRSLISSITFLVERLMVDCLISTAHSYGRAVNRSVEPLGQTRVGNEADYALVEVNLHSMFSELDSGISVADAALMTQPGLGSKQHRWAWTFLFVLAGAISMVGPTQAVSGLVTASVTVMAALSRVLAPAAESGSAASESRAPSAHSALPFASGSQMITIDRAVALMEEPTDLLSLDDSGVSNDALTNSGDTGTSNQGGGAGSGGRKRAGSGGSGGGGVGGGGAGGSASPSFEPGAFNAASAAGSTADLPGEGSTVALTSDADVMAAIVGGGAVSESVIDSATGAGDVIVDSVVQSLLGSHSGSPAFEAADDFLSDASQSSDSFSSGSPARDDGRSGGEGTSGVSPFAGPDVLSAMGLSQPLAVGDGDSGGPAVNDQSSLALADAGNIADASTGGGVGVAQLPEPSGLVLLSLGAAAVLRHTRRRR